MNRRQTVKLLLAGAVGWAAGLFPRRSYGQTNLLIPTAYLVPKYIAPMKAPSKGVLAGKNERGERFTVAGRVLDKDRPLKNASIYAFHADADGFYTRDGRNSDENARLFATFRTDGRGRYQFETISPGAYGSLSAHVHFVIRADGYKPRLFDLWLGDDPVLAANRLTGRNLPSADFIRPVTRDKAGMWHAQHDIPMIRDDA
jgi:protocatechuate 3,4-dioxygenase beta subunit